MLEVFPANGEIVKNHGDPERTCACEGTGAAKVVVVTDIGADLDDEWSMMIYAALQRRGYICVHCMVANLRPSMERARLLHGMVGELGYGYDLPAIPVGMGTGIIANRNNELHPTEQNCSYLSPYSDLRVGDEVTIDVLLDAAPKSLTVVLQSGFTDFAMLALLHGELLAAKTAKVVIMGGVVVNEAGDDVVLDHGLLQPDQANNNTFNFTAAQVVYRWCQDQCVPMVITMRSLAYSAKFPFSMYEWACSMTESPIGPCMRDRQESSLQTLWGRANAPVASEARGPLPPDRDREWFVTVFCDGVDPGIGAEERILPHTGSFMLYDPINAMAAVDVICDHYFTPHKVVVNGTTHQIIGLSKAHPGITPERAQELVAVMIDMILMSLNAGVAAKQLSGQL